MTIVIILYKSQNTLSITMCINFTAYKIFVHNPVENESIFILKIKICLFKSSALTAVGYVTVIPYHL